MIEELNKRRPHKVPEADQIVGLLGDLSDLVLSEIVIRISFFYFQAK